MKISPLAQGTGVPGNSDTAPVNHDKIARAKAIAAGQAPAPAEESSGDPQVDRARQSIRRIKMKTQVSTNRHDPVTEEPAAVAANNEVPESGATLPTENPIPDPNEPASVVEDTKPLSPQFAALAKQKRALQVKERELAQREQALKTQSPAGNEDLIAKLKANPLSVLQEHGVTYDQLTEAILANQSGSSSEIVALKQELKAIKEGLDQQLNQRDEVAEKQVLSQLKRETDLLVSQGEEFEAIREAKAQQLVVDLIHRTFKESGEVMDVSEAAELVENQLIDEALPFARIKKVQSRLTPEVVQAAQEQQIAAPKPGTKVMRTLTNRDSAQPLSDRRQRAIAAFTGTLKRG